MADKKAEFERLRIKYEKLGWLAREDILWLLAALEEELQDKTTKD